jgi:hypothetical protein
MLRLKPAMDAVERDTAEIDWKAFKTIDEISNGQISEPWLLAVEMIRDVTRLRICAEGSWSPLPGVLADCGPDGHSGLSVPADRLVIPDCAVGALLGRFGGSSAGYQSTADADTKPFSIGKYCAVIVPPKAFGPLFIGSNTFARPLKITRLKITIEGATPTL